jgi:hypothetical protein
LLVLCSCGDSFIGEFNWREGVHGSLHLLAVDVLHSVEGLCD